MATVLPPVLGVDLIVDSCVRFGHETNVLPNPARLDVARVARLSRAEPGSIVALPRPDIEIVANADHPYGHRVSERAVASEGRQLDLFSWCDLANLVVRPGGYP